MIERIPGTNLLAETKAEAEQQVDKQKRYKQIIEILKENNKGLTAKEISVEMKSEGYTPTDERNFSSPRLTEMLKKGQVECIGKKKCEYSNKTVGVFILRKICTICGNAIDDFDDRGIYCGEYCEECFNEAQESRLK